MNKLQSRSWVDLVTSHCLLRRLFIGNSRTPYERKQHNTINMSADRDPELAKNDLKVTNSVSSGEAAPVPVEGETHHLPTFEHERALTWKFDLRMLPMLAVGFMRFTR